MVDKEFLVPVDVQNLMEALINSGEVANARKRQSLKGSFTL